MAPMGANGELAMLKQFAASEYTNSICGGHEPPAREEPAAHGGASPPVRVSRSAGGAIPPARDRAARQSPPQKKRVQCTLRSGVVLVMSRRRQQAVLFQHGFAYLDPEGAFTNH